MPLLHQSAFLQSLGWAIANSLWQMAALWLGYQLWIGINKKAGASVKNAIATVLLFAGSVWFVYSFLHKYFQLQSEVILVLQADNLQNQQTLNNLVATGSHWQNGVNLLLNRFEQYLPILSTAYLLIFTFLFIRLLFAWYQSLRLMNKGLLQPDIAWQNHFQQLVLQSGIRFKVRFRLSEIIDVPATVGFIKPVVLLPIAALNQLSTAQVEAVLLHELAHIKRYDYFINLLVAVAETLLFFNPFAVLLANHLKKERENSCDDFVLRFHNQPESYARALLALEQNRIYAQPLLLKATGDGELLLRVKRIMNVPVKNFNYRYRLLAFVVTAGILSSLAWIKPSSVTNHTTTQALNRNSLATKSGVNKIILTPSIIEKKPGGDLILFDAKKNNSLLVKRQGNKIKLLDEANHVEIAANEINLDRVPILTPPPTLHTPPPVPAPANKSIALPEPALFSGFILPDLQLTTESIKRELNKNKINLQLNKTALLKSFKKVQPIKEWEQLPTKEDWQQLEQKFETEMAKLELQLKLNDGDGPMLDSAIQENNTWIQVLPVNFDANRLQQEQILNTLLQLRALAEAFRQINTKPNPTQSLRNVHTPHKEASAYVYEYAWPQPPVIIMPGQPQPPKEISAPEPASSHEKKQKRLKVIVSL